MHPFEKSVRNPLDSLGAPKNVEADPSEYRSSEAFQKTAKLPGAERGGSGSESCQKYQRTIKKSMKEKFKIHKHNKKNLSLLFPSGVYDHRNTISSS